MRSLGHDGVMDLDDVADELYAVSPDDFVKTRTARVAEARKAKDQPLVKAIGKLRRPTRSAWLVNLLARAASDDLEGLLDLGAALSEAQRRLSGPDLRRLSTQRHAAVEALVRRAAEIAVDHGHTPTEATRREVSETLQAALADRDIASQVRAGRVVQSATYGGFGPTDFLAAVPSLPPEADEPAEDEAAADPAPKDKKKLIKAKKELTATRKTLQQAQAVLGDSEREVTEATTSADQLSEQVTALRAQLEELKAEERGAREQAQFAKKRVQQLRQEVNQAEDDVAQVEAEVGRLT